MSDNLTSDEIRALKAAKNADEWNRACDDIKRARSGQYPPDWFSTVITGGLLASVKATWS